MINIPKDLSDIEVGLYKSGYEYCEKLVKEENIAIAEAVENTADRFSGLKMIAIQSRLLGYVTQTLKTRLGGMSLKRSLNSSRNIGAVTMIIC